jgi:hypothetical protein
MAEQSPLAVLSSSWTSGVKWGYPRLPPALIQVNVEIVEAISNFPCRFG